MPWTETVRRSFTPVELADYLAELDFGGWRPKFCVLHNTGAPTLVGWMNYPLERRLENLEHYYRNEQGWSSGPHWFVDRRERGIHAFTPTNVPGTHSPSWNSVAIGVEMAGDYETEPFDPGVRDNAVALLVALHRRLDLDPDTIRLHREDPRTTHRTCPGRYVNKSEIIARVKAELQAPAPRSAVLVSPVPLAKEKPAAHWQRVMDHIASEEGGYREHRDEHGGAAGRGVSLELFARWRIRQGKPAPTKQDLKSITRAEAEAIFRAEYAAPVHFDALPVGLDYVVLDWAINGGVTQAIRTLREACGLPRLIAVPASALLWAARNGGSAFLVAEEQRNVAALIARYQDARLAQYRSFTRPSGGWRNPVYRRVWGGRVDRARARALQMLT